MHGCLPFCPADPRRLPSRRPGQWHLCWTRPPCCRGAALPLRRCPSLRPGSSQLRSAPDLKTIIIKVIDPCHNDSPSTIFNHIMLNTMIYFPVLENTNHVKAFSCSNTKKTCLHVVMLLRKPKLLLSPEDFYSSSLTLETPSKKVINKGLCPPDAFYTIN